MLTCKGDLFNANFLVLDVGLDGYGLKTERILKMVNKK